MPYRLSPEGVVDVPNYVLSDEAVNTVRNISQVAKLPHDKGQKLLNDIEQAIRWALAYKQMPLPGRANLSKAIAKIAKLSKQLDEALNELPPQAMPFFNNCGSTISEQKRLAGNLMVDCGKAAELAKVALAGRGETPKGDIQKHLCRDIAKALESAGIKTTFSRPKTENNDGGPFWQISKICFKETNISIADMKKYMIDGRSMLKK